VRHTHVTGWLLVLPAAVLLATFTHDPAVGPLLMAFLLFQRQFVQSFMRAGIR